MLQNRNLLICLVGIMVYVSWDLGIHLDKIRCWLKLKANIFADAWNNLKTEKKKFILPGFPREWRLRKPQKIAILGNPAARQMPQGEGPELANFSSHS